MFYSDKVFDKQNESETKNNPSAFKYILQSSIVIGAIQVKASYKIWDWQIVTILCELIYVLQTDGNVNLQGAISSFSFD